MIKKVMILLAVLQIGLLGGMQIELQFNEPIINNNEFRNDLPVNLQPGEPKIAYYPVKILLPMGQGVNSVNITWSEYSEQENVQIDFAKQQIPISTSYQPQTKQNEEIYGKNAFFPDKEMDFLGTQRYRGHEMLLLNLYPYVFNPIEEKVGWHSKAKIEIKLSSSVELYGKQNKMLVASQATEKFLEKIVINPEQMHTYSKTIAPSSRLLPDSNQPFEMIIITDEQREPYFTEFIEWKENQGMAVGLFLTSAIYSQYSGEDNPAKIRNFIADAFAVYSATDTPLEYVILGGDDSIIPIRGTYGQVGSYVDYSIPTDLYYSCLDGDWDGNGNGIYGEYQDLPEMDLIPEVAIGRISAQTETDFMRLFNKTYHYVENTTPSQDIAYMIGENLNWNPLTWGAWYKEEIRPIIEDNSDFKVFSLYEMEGNYSGYTVREAINKGLSIINHMGHSNENVVFGQGAGNANSFTNSEYGFAYSQGCYPAAFDHATSDDIGCIAENLTTAENGLYAFVGNTRYGWYSPGDTNGASQYYDITFFQALFEENIRSLGEALQYSRVALLNEALTVDVMRWVYYQMVVFGDPSVEVKEPTNAFPYLEPVSLQFDDISGDGDGVINPGEHVHIYPTIRNLPDWADAQNVYCIADFPADFIVIRDSIFVGNIAENSEVSSNEFFEVIIPEDCDYDDYSFQLTIYSEVAGHNMFEKSYNMTIPVSLFQANWPVYSPISLRSNPVLLSNASQFDILTTDVNGNLHRYDSGGNLIHETNQNSESIRRSAAMADINQNGEDDLVFASRNGVLFSMDLNGEEIFSYHTDADFMFTPVIADLTGNGSWETIANSVDMHIHVVNHQGELLPNFPYQLDQMSFGELAAADITGDGNYEIIAGTLAGTVYVIDSDGNDCPGFPLYLDEVIRTAPTILDNGNIVIGTAMNYLYIISPQGDILATLSLNSTVANSVIAADFTNDGNLEIAFVTTLGDMYIIEQDGTVLEGWPVSLPVQFIHPPLAADLDNDDNLELIAVSNLNTVFAYHIWGEPVTGTPVPINLPNDTPATIADIDGDGDFELVGSSENTIYAIDFKTPKGTKLPWSTYRGNVRRTGNYADNNLTESYDSLVPASTLQLYANYPNPFNPLTHIRFSLPEPTSVTLAVYNIKGQKVKTLVAAEMQPGEYKVKWNGTDSTNRPVASGVYLYRLKTDNQDLIRKCLLLK